MQTIDIQFPKKLQNLFKPYRYKVLHGGRGGAKSWGVARALLLLGAQNPIRVLCAREFQNSIADSVIKLLADQLEPLGLSDHYEVQKTIIKGKNGTTFSFEGLRHNVTKIKSYEGVDYCWIEEAQTVSKSSWDVLIPTIRKPDSEIIITFNPVLESDETYQRFVENPPTNSWVQQINWSDNPWFPDVLKQEMEDLKRRDFAAYRNVWLGECKLSVDGAIYANEMQQASDDGRICGVPYDTGLQVYTFWDLGWNDTTAIWFMQIVGREFRFIDFYESSGAALSHYVKVLDEKGYRYAAHYLPHDVEVTELGTGRSRKATLESLGMSNIEVVPRVDSLLDGIESTRQMMTLCWWDKDKCADGLKSLRNYRREYCEKTQTTKQTPLHDWASNAADAFRQFGQGFDGFKRTKSTPNRNRRGAMSA